MTEDNDAVRIICEQHQLALVAVLPPATGSLFLAHVRDGKGRDLLLKRGNGIRGDFEGPVSIAWANDPSSPGCVEELDEHTFVREWIEGVPLECAGERVPALLRKVGTALRRLHSVSPPEGLPKLWERFSPEVVLAEWNGALPSRMLERAAALAIQLRTHRADPAVLVHGDLVPSNVLIRPDGSVVIIDPIGFVGMRARDLAQMAVATAGRDRRLNLDDLLKGYGERPPFIDEVFAWLVFMFLEKNIELERAHPHTRATFVLELSSLAETFVANA